MKYLIIIMTMAIFLNAEGLKQCEIESEYIDSSIAVSNESVVDYARGTAEKSIASVKDYFDEVTVVEHTGEVTDYVSGDTQEYVKTTTDYTKGTSEVTTKTTKDYERGLAKKNTSSVRDTLDSTKKEHSTQVTDYARGASNAKPVAITDYASGESKKHTGFVVDYTRGTSTKKTGTAMDYAQRAGPLECSFQGVSQEEIPIFNWITGAQVGTQKATFVVTSGPWSQVMVSVLNNKDSSYGWEALKIQFDIDCNVKVKKDNVLISTVKANRTGVVKSGTINYDVKNASRVTESVCQFNALITQGQNNYTPATLLDGTSILPASIGFPGSLVGFGTAGDGAVYSDTCSIIRNGKEIKVGDYFSESSTTIWTSTIKYTNRSILKGDLSPCVGDSCLGCSSDYTNIASYCMKAIEYDYYEYSCDSGYTIDNLGVSSCGKVDPDIDTKSESELSASCNNATPPSKNCYKAVDYNFYEYSCAQDYTMRDEGYQTYSKTDRDFTIRNDTVLGRNINSAIPPSKNCSKSKNVSRYEYTCQDGYTASDNGVLFYERLDGDIINYNADLFGPINSSTPPNKNCSKKDTFTYYGFMCPSTYTAIDKGYNVVTRADTNLEAYNSDLFLNENLPEVSNSNCYKDISYDYYSYSCSGGYSAVETGFDSHTKSDPDAAKRNDSQLELIVNQSAPPFKNCSKTISYNQYKYSCPVDYATANNGYDSFVRTDSDFERRDEVKLSLDVNSQVPPVKNCSTQVEYTQFKHSCPSPYNIQNAGSSNVVKVDKQLEVDNRIELSANLNEGTVSLENCYKDLTYKYYEYKYPAGLVVEDKGIASMVRIDANKKTNNIAELSTTANSSTPPAQNAYQNVSYDIFSYSCPSGYAPVDSGLARGTKIDTDSKKDNSAELGKPENNFFPPLKNCSKTLNYNYFDHSCIFEINEQKFNWEVVSGGNRDRVKHDSDLEAVSLELLGPINDDIVATNNCARSYQICDIECPTGMQLDINTSTCYESYESECEKRGLLYDSNLTKCVTLEDYACPTAGYMSDDNTRCLMEPQCEVSGGECIQPKQTVCTELDFVYNRNIGKCEKRIDCADAQIASANSEYCQSLPYCYQGDSEMSDKCVNKIPESPVECAEDQRIGNTCFKQDSGEQELISRKKLETHEIRGDGIAAASFEQYNLADCSTDGNCESGITKIIGRTGVLCFEKPNGQSSCIEAKGCNFSGSIEASGYLTTLWIDDKNYISALDSAGGFISKGITSSCEMTGAVGYKERPFPIVSMKVSEDKLEFWNSYSNEGYVGLLEFPPSVDRQDIEDGYQIEEKKLWLLKDSGFGVISVIEGDTYAISNNGMSASECDAIANNYGYSVYGATDGIPANTERGVYDLVMNLTGANYNSNTLNALRTVNPTICAGSAVYNSDTMLCSDGQPSLCPANTVERFVDEVISNEDLNATSGGESEHGESGRDKDSEYYKNRSPDVCFYTLDMPQENKCVLIAHGYQERFSNSEWSVMINKASNTEYFCSQLECGNDNTCQSANCADDYKGNVISPSGTQPTRSECVDDTCDANKPYFEYCGKEGFCDTSSPDITRVGRDCVQITCEKGGFDEATKTCYKWQCPRGYEEENGACVEK